MPRPGLPPWRSGTHDRLKERLRSKKWRTQREWASPRLSRSEGEVKAGLQSCESLGETVSSVLQRESPPSSSSIPWHCS